MAERTILWPGKSGKEYKHWIYELDYSMEESPGNYVFARETEPDRFRPIYIGETDDLHRRLNVDEHEKMPCIQENGATHICAHTSSANEKERRAEEADLVERWDPVCNKE